MKNQSESTDDTGENIQESEKNNNHECDNF